VARRRHRAPGRRLLQSLHYRRCTNHGSVRWMRRERSGVLLCLLAAAAFSSATVFGRFALDDGAGVLTILALRYSGAALLFWALVALTAQRLPGRTAVLQVLLLGAVAMALQAVLFFSALARLDAGLVTLLLY